MRYGIGLWLLLQTTLPLLSCNTATQPKADCAKYWTGKFYYHFTIDDISSVYTIIRTDSTQQEINDETHDTTTLQVTWLSECTYELRFLRSTEVLSDSDDQMRKQFVVQTTIESGDGRYYTSHTKNNLDHDIGTDTIWLDRWQKPVRVR